MRHGLIRQWARRLGIVAVALVLQQPLPVHADGDAQSSFLKVVKRDISGKTGQPVQSLEVHPDGEIVLKDGAGANLAAAHLSEADLTAFGKLLANPALLTVTAECGQAMGADLPETELIVQQVSRTLTLRFGNECRLPATLQPLWRLLDKLERKYLPSPG